MVEKVVRVLTANLANGDAAAASLQSALEAARPDIAAFQELAPAQGRVVEQHFPHGFLDPRRDYHGMGIAAHQPVAVERFPMTHRDGWRALLRPDDWRQLNEEIELINVHIQNPLMLPLRETSANRRGQVDDILAYAKAHRMPRIIVGDMNSSPAWRSYKRLAAQFQDAALAVETAEPTWAYFPWMPRLLRIDHVFIEGLVAVNTHTVKIKGTDHSAVVADLRTA